MQSHRRLMQNLNTLAQANKPGTVLSSMQIRQDMWCRVPAAVTKRCPVDMAREEATVMGTTFRQDTLYNLVALQLHKTPADTTQDPSRGSHKFRLPRISLDWMN